MKNVFILLGLIIALMLICTTNGVFTQWSDDTNDNKAISTTTGERLAPAIASDGKGGTIITRYDYDTGTNVHVSYHSNIDGHGYSVRESITSTPMAGGVLAKQGEWNGQAGSQSVCGVVPGSYTECIPSGVDSFGFRINGDGTRVDSIRFILHDVCGFARLEVNSWSPLGGALIDSTSCIAKWSITCYPNISHGHEITINFINGTVVDSVKPPSNCNSTCAVIEFTFPPTDVVEESEAFLPSHIKLEQSFPNPFNSSTRIQFSLPRSSYVTLKVYNTSGQAVATLVAQHLSPGRYDFDWNADGKASGVYYYRLQAGSFTESKKLILLK